MGNKKTNPNEWEYLLEKIYNTHLDFNPTEMDDGNYTISILTTLKKKIYL